MIEHPTPQTPEQMEHEVLQSIRRVCWDMIRAIDAGQTGGVLDTHFNFLESQWRRRKTITSTIQQKPRNI